MKRHARTSASSPAGLHASTGTLCDFFDRTDETAIVIGETRRSRAELAEAASQLAAGFMAAGVGAGDRVVLHLDTSFEIIIAYFACFRIGAIACPMYAHYSSAYLKRMFGRLRPALYLGHADLYRKVADLDDCILPGRTRFIVDAGADPKVGSWSDLQ